MPAANAVSGACPNKHSTSPHHSWQPHQRTEVERINMRTRIVSALILIALIALPLWRGGFLFAGLVFLVTLLGIWELLRMVLKAHYQHLLVPAAAALFAFIAGAAQGDLVVVALGLSLLVLGGLILQLALDETHDKIREWSILVAATLYLGWPGMLLVLLRNRADGLWWVVLIVIATTFTDSGAYLAGRMFGRHLFSPRYSPKKTWEGVAGGIVSCVAAMLLYGTRLLELEWWLTIFIGVGLSLAAVYGDLAESMLKRRAGVKDSSHLIPGHGGVLDRVDSLIFVTTVTFFIAHWLG